MASDRNRLRLQLELTQAGDQVTGAFPIVNFFTGRSPVIARGRAYGIEIVLMNNGALDTAVGNITSITLEIKTYLTPSVAPFVSKTLAAGDMNPALTDADRLAAINQHCTFLLDAGDTGFDMTGADANNNLNWSIVITATRGGNLVTICDGTIIVHSDGGQYSGNTPTAGDATYLTAAQTLALIRSSVPVFGQPGGALVLVNNNNQQMRLYLDDTGVLQTPVSPYVP